MTDALAQVAQHAHARPINGGGSASWWTRDEILDMNAQEAV
jgi:hypothetical protein